MKITLESYFSDLSKGLVKGFVRHLESVIRSVSSSNYEMAPAAQAFSMQNGQDSNMNTKNLNDWLSNLNLQIDDNDWRMPVRLVFDWLKEYKIINKKEKLETQELLNVNKTKHGN